MINKSIVYLTIEKIQGTKYTYESLLESLILYVKNYIQFEYKEEDLEESVREGIRLYFDLMNKRDKEELI